MIAGVQHREACTVSPGDVFRFPTLSMRWSIASRVAVHAEPRGGGLSVEIIDNRGDYFLLPRRALCELLPQPTNENARPEPGA